MPGKPYSPVRSPNKTSFNNFINIYNQRTYTNINELTTKQLIGVITTMMDSKCPPIKYLSEEMALGNLNQSSLREIARIIEYMKVKSGAKKKILKGINKDIVYHVAKIVYYLNNKLSVNSFEEVFGDLVPDDLDLQSTELKAEEEVLFSYVIKLEKDRAPEVMVSRRQQRLLESIKQSPEPVQESEKTVSSSEIIEEERDPRYTIPRRIINAIRNGTRNIKDYNPEAIFDMIYDLEGNRGQLIYTEFCSILDESEDWCIDIRNVLERDKSHYPEAIYNLLLEAANEGIEGKSKSPDKRKAHFDVLYAKMKELDKTGIEPASFEVDFDMNEELETR